MTCRPAPRVFSAVLLPILLSVGVHALLLAGLWLYPAGADQPADKVLDTRIEVSLVELAEVPSPFPPQIEERARPAAEESEERISEVRFEAGPSYSSSDPASDTAHAPTVTGPRPSPGSAGGNGGGAEGIEQRLLAVPRSVRSVVYVMDRSVSMGFGDALPLARRAVLAGLQQLPAGTRFQVIAYNEQAEPLRVQGQAGLLPAEPAIVAEVEQLLEEVSAAGETRHLLALQHGLALRPDVLFFLTDADDLLPAEVHTITQLNQGRTRIFTLELSRPHPLADSPLQQLARANGGTYRCVAPHP